MVNGTSDPDSFNVSDPKRQAIPPLRGFEYQIWQSVLRWITLHVGEALFLEGAEDIDVLRDGEVETVQVKETARSGSVTLNTASVVEAIGHFWDHQKTNPSYIVRFRFLTTSERGREQDAPFMGERGLDFWDRCKRPHTNLEPLRLFLAKKTSLPPDLREFISNASDEDLRDKLIRRVEWDTGQGDHTQIEELIQKRAITHGAELYALPPSESVRVVPHLFSHVWAVVRQADNRRLEYADFARIFEEQSTIRITRRELQRRTNAPGMAQGLGPVMSTELNSLDLVAESAPQAYAILPLQRLAKREQLVTDLRARLNVRGILVLKGSSGMGKSTLAGLIAVGESGRWRRLDMQDLEPERVKEHLVYATLTDTEQAAHPDYVIDDLNFDKRPILYERALSGFIHAVISRGGRVIITTQGDIPSRVALAFDLSESVIFDVPALTEEEVEQVALAHGCPTGKKLETWRRIIHTTTLGHPLLVHARVKNVAAAGWPTPRIEDILAAQDVEEVRREVRQRLREQLPSEQARTLAYRLDVFSLYFKRPHALFIAQHPPALSTPGEAFDLLIGPWVESVGNNYYRLSPLLRTSSAQAYSPEQVKDLHKSAAYSFLEGVSVITQTELSNVLFHGLLGEISEPMLAAANATATIKDEDWPLVAREVDWFAHVALQPGEKLFKVNPITSLTLRLLQFRIAAAIDSADLAPKVVTSWEHELKAFDEHLDDEDLLVFRMAFQFFFNIILVRLEVPLSLRSVINHIATTINLLRKCREAASSGNELVKQAIEMSPEDLGNIDGYVLSASFRCKRADDVAEFLEALEEQEPGAAEEIWSQLRNSEFISLVLVNGAWLREVKEASPDWTHVLEVLGRTAELALSKQADALAAGAYRSKAILLKEYIPAGGNALEVLAEGNSQLGYEHPVIQDYLAKIHMLDGRYQEALEVWNRIPPEPETEETSSRTFSHREAVMCAGNIGDWNAAAEYALQGEKAARRLLHLGDVIAVGFLAEYAFAVWQSGDHLRALSSYACVIDELRALPDHRSDIKSFALHMKILHTIKWIGKNTVGEENVIQPQLGWFSDPNFDEAKRVKPIPPYQFYWYYLADAEYKVGEDAGIFQRLDDELRKRDIPLVKTQAEGLRLKYSLRNLTLERLVAEYAAYASSVRAFSTSQNRPVPPDIDRWMLIVLTFAALVNLVSVGRVVDVPVDKWREDASAHGFLDDVLEKFFETIEYAISEDEETLCVFLKDPSQSIELRLVVALILSASDSLYPEDRFIANVILATTDNAYAMWREETESVIEDLVANRWASVVERQRFALLSPSTVAPQILNNCRDESTQGLRKAARVLLAARKAVRVDLHEQVLTQLQKMAE